MNPYKDLPQNAFWKPAISEKNMFDISDIWDPKFHIKQEDRVITYGSCFAQHVGSALKRNGFTWYQTEEPPYGLSEINCKKFNYNVFSSRTGNIYTTSLLRQWVDWALENKDIPDEVWECEGRYYDPFRPRIEPDGFESVSELFSSRMEAVRAFKKSLIKADYFIFTLGLTESWINTVNKYEYPMCPGTAAGVFDKTKHRFVNQQFTQIINNLVRAVDMIRSINPTIKIILTVSPVPLTATKSNQHILVASMASKSILRAVADQLSKNRGYVDYFPSYEIISSPVFKGAFYEPNMRSVSTQGVNFVMENFFTNMGNKFGYEVKIKKQHRQRIEEVCEEELLEAFGS